MIDAYVRHSPSALNLFAAEPAMFVLERILGEKQIVGVPAHRGVAIEDGVTHGVVNPKAALRDCIDIALTKYDALTCLTGDPRRMQYRATIGDMVERAVSELRQYGVPSRTQGFIEWKPPGIELPIVGYFDYEWSQHGIIADLKTSEKMPSEIKTGHARQVALYALSDNIDARLLYVTPKKMTPYRLENIREHRKALLRIAQTVERFLALSDEPEYFVSITMPDLDSFYWNNPASRQLAYKHWGV
jgi:hypothetical protein